MFMTTCWMYELPVKHSAPQLKDSSILNSPSIPAGSFQGVMQQIPVQLTLKNPGAGSETVSYEATLTLKPILQPPPASALYGAPQSREEPPQKAKLSGRQKESLKNMRRSPYFSIELLQPPPRRSVSSRSEERVRIETANSKSKTESNEKSREKSEVHREFGIPSREEAEKDVGSMLAMVSRRNSNSSDSC